MKKLLLLGLGAVMITGCGKIGRMLHEVGGPQVVGSGKLTTETRQVSSFKNVQLDGAMDAEITIGKQSGIKIEGDDNIVPFVKTAIEGDTLRIYMEGSYSMRKNLKVTFTVPELEGATINGSGNIALHAYKGKSLALILRGSGDVTAEGTVDKLAVEISGSGDFDLFGLAASDAKVEIRGSGDAEINATGNLDGDISGSGSIRYKGSPRHVNKSIAGSGEITAASN